MTIAELQKQVFEKLPDTAYENGRLKEDEMVVEARMSWEDYIELQASMLQEIEKVNMLETGQPDSLVYEQIKQVKFIPNIVVNLKPGQDAASSN